MIRVACGEDKASKIVSHSSDAGLQDIFTLFHLDRPFKFVSKTSNFFIPIVGWSMFLTGMTPSQRTASNVNQGLPRKHQRCSLRSDECSRTQDCTFTTGRRYPEQLIGFSCPIVGG